MHLDVNDLRNFYYRTPLGRVAQRAIRDELIRLWPPRPEETVAGYGFAVPLLRPYLDVARRVIGLMPGPQGVMPWPAGLPNVAVLCSEADWPIGDGMVDRLVLMHGIETSEDPAAVMAEAYRVLAPGGVAMFVVPNRTGLWARRDATPFGYGRPYSGVQLEAHLRSHGFAPERSLTVLHAPPSRAPFWLRTAGFFERLGRALPWLSGGVLMVEATKQVIAPMRGGLGANVTRRRAAPKAIAQPVPSPMADGWR